MRNLLVLLFLLPLFLKSQTNVWNNNPVNERAFVKNLGQYDGRNWQSTNDIKYALSQQDGWFTFFTNKGITHRLEKLVRNPNKKKGEHDKPSRVHTSELIDVFFIGGNSNVQIVAEDKTNHYYSYAVKDITSNEVRNISKVSGYKKITYKNIYDKIDIEYTLHPNGGIKYNIILHPGADASKVKMQYNTSHTNILNEDITLNLNPNGQIEINTSATKLIEHKPVTFYKNSTSPINSKYIFNNNILSFELGNYDKNQTVIIDPWVVTPNFNAGDFTREVETDAAGNVYVIGGEIPMELRKYNALGVFQWTYVTPWDTNGGDWLGTLATDAAGVSYITQGTGAEIERVSTAGIMAWHANAPFVLFGLAEYWSITFNCDNTRLIVGGTGGTAFSPQAKIYDMNLSNGSIISSVNVGTQSGFTPIEVRSIAPTKNSKYAYLTHHQVGIINQNLTACSAKPDFEVDNTHHLGYKCENYLSSAQNGGGLKALIANDNYYYTHRGDQILQWDITNGTLLNTVALPGGSSNNTFGRVVHCSGLDVDAVGNVYAGSMDRVVKFDPNLNIISSTNTTGGFTVYDVSVNSNGEVLAVGALLNNSTSTGRGGRIESLSMTAGAQYATVCCDPNFCPVGPLCVTGPPVSLNPNTGGGTWSSAPATPGLNTTTGVFSPAVSGVGTFTITYTLGCGSYSTVIQVGNCSAMSICVEANGDLTVTGGTGPYNWYEWVPASSTPITNQTQCTNCGGTWTFGNCFNPFPTPLNNCVTPAGWSQYGTGTTVTPPVGGDTIKVVDSFGDSIVVLNIALLPPCVSGCDATITQAGPFCLNDPAINLSAVQPGGTWSGTGITNPTNGTFNPSTAGAGSHIITYTLTSCSDTVTLVVNPDDTATFSYPSASYCLSDPNPLPTGIVTTGGTFTINNSGVINASSGLINLTGSGIGNYTVTYTTNGPCPDTATFNIAIVNSANATITPAGPFCLNDPSLNLTAAQAGGTWSGTGITNPNNGTFDPNTAGAGTHTITYGISGNCGDTQTVNIVVNPSDTATFSYPSGSYCLTDPDPLPTGIITTGGTFTINNSGVINASSGLINLTSSGIGNYIITYITNGPCPDTATFNIAIVNSVNATITPAGPFCTNDPSVTLSAVSPGGTWSGTGITNPTTGTFDPNTAGAGTHTITYGISGSCGDTQTVNILVIPQDTAAFTYPSGSYCLTDPDPLPTITGTTGGTFTIDNSGLINATTGLIDLTGSGIGAYIVTYITNGTCPDTATFNISIVNATNATITPAGPFCANDPSVTLSAVSPGGTWSGTGITNPTTGVFDPNTAGPGSHTITYGISGSCGDTQTVSITVNPSDTATFSYTPTTFCDTDPNPSPTGIVTTGGTFTINNGGTINGTTGQVNLLTSGAGTYTITYITNGACPDTATFGITISTCATPTAAYSVSDSTICDGECVTFTDLSTGATMWQWTFNGGTPSTANTQGPHSVCFNGPGIYNIELIASNSTGADTITSTVEVYANPIVNAGSDVTIDLGQSVTLNATGTNGTHTWSPPTWLSCVICPSPVATPQETTTYTVIVVDSNGCSASDEVTVIVDFDFIIWVPNIFSPNGDGNNDIAFVRGVGVEYLNFVIYDRWGEKVFETNDLSNGWDGTFRGKKMNNGVFVYYLQATFKNGEEVTKKGDITLIR